MTEERKGFLSRLFGRKRAKQPPPDSGAPFVVGDTPPTAEGLPEAELSEEERQEAMDRLAKKVEEQD